MLVEVRAAGASSFLISRWKLRHVPMIRRGMKVQSILVAHLITLITMADGGVLLMDSVLMVKAVEYDLIVFRMLMASFTV